jgi:hypothetical protein
MDTDILEEHGAGWKGLTVQDSSLLDCLTLHLQQHHCENLTALRLNLTHEDGDSKFLQDTLSYLPHYSVSLHVYFDHHM